MQYLIVFLEGIITFVSPCLLPLLPVYVSCFAGGEGRSKTIKNALGFIIGFTMVFVTLGAFAGTLGSMLHKYHHTLNIICGFIVVIFGLSNLGIFKITIFHSQHHHHHSDKLRFFSAVLFGIVFSVSHVPCTSAFLGSALMQASSGANAMAGIILLFVYSLGLGIPFLICAILIDRLGGAIGFIKRNYKIINIVCGIFLIIIGILMMTGVFCMFID